MENLVPPLKRGARGDLRVSWENLTPQPPSLRGKGEPESPSPLRGGVGEGSEFVNTYRQGEPDSLQECRGGVFFGESIPMPKLPTGRQGYCIGGLIKELRSGNLARLNLCCVGENGFCRD